MLLAATILIPFLLSLLPAALQRLRVPPAAAAGGVAGIAAVLLGLQAPAVASGEVVAFSIPWVPVIGLDFALRLDGLSLLFAGLIVGIGLLVILYAHYYLSDEDRDGRFFAYLLLFMGAMLGVVTADNLLLLLVFWELTSLSSFLLIGFWRGAAEARQGARLALLVTGAGGLALLGGVLLIGDIVGSYSLGAVLAASDAIRADPRYPVLLVLVLLGAFTKSAQFPFHFWLPHAMAAPTPVSAYLHSATMVKAGLFLMARLWPVLAGTDEWVFIVATTGLVTMVIGAVIAFFNDDLKGLLAFSTVSHLGLITMLLGFGTESAAVVAVFHIINHASFKAALFMTAGIVDHETGTRDIKRLGGLRHLMPITFIIATITALSMAGIPPLNGFISKEMMLKETTYAVWLGNGFIVPALATLGAVFSVAYSFRYIWHVFMGPLRKDYPSKPHDPGFGMWAGPALLAVIVIAVGVMPGLVEPLVLTVAAAVTGAEPEVHLKLWHGVNAALFMSIAAIVGGAFLLSAHARLDRDWQRSGPPAAKPIFDAIVGALTWFARWLTGKLHDGSFTRFAAIFTATVIVAGLLAWHSGEARPATRDGLPVTFVPLVGAVLLAGATICVAVFHRHRLLALVLIGVVGLMVSLGFAYFSAPDLAMTQLSVEVVTIILLLLALNFLPRESPRESTAARRWRDVTLAVASGGAAMALSYAMMMSDFALPTISGYHLANAYKGGGGTNVVNVILVDFRGFDTFGEIIVLGIAALVIFALTQSVLTGAGGRFLEQTGPLSKKSGDRHPLMMVVATRAIMPMAILVGIYIFLRGHNEPGGGFIAGLVVAIALLMQYMASGFAWAEERQRLTYHATIALGVLIATATGVGAWFNGMPFLTSAHDYFPVPGIAVLHLSTAVAFDVGVFLTVVGAVMLALWSLSNMARRSGETVNVEPMDVKLEGGTANPDREG